MTTRTFSLVFVDVMVVRLRPFDGAQDDAGSGVGWVGTFVSGCAFDPENEFRVTVGECYSAIRWIVGRPVGGGGVSR